MSVVEVVTGARLHFGLICGGKFSANRFGGIGLMLRSPGWHISSSLSGGSSCTASTTEVRHRVARVLSEVCHDSGLSGLRVTVHDEIPLHCGLGAGTQITLALASAARITAGLPRPADSMLLAARLNRVRRSAVGAYGFDRGGFIVDDGQSTDRSGRELHNYEFPDRWRVVLLSPTGEAGLSGTQEESVFRRQHYMTESMIQTQLRLIHDSIIPSVTKQEFEFFCGALEEYGRNAGNFFRRQQGGVFSGSVIRRLLQAREFKDLQPVQSSWGPTVAVFTQTRNHADEVVARLQRSSFKRNVCCRIAEPLNCGASVKTVAPEDPDYVVRG